MSPHVITWTVAALATAGVIVRPFNLPEAIWAVAGAVVLVALGLISMPDALTGVAKGTDVYLFLFGMMLLAEIAREEGLFAWLAAVATSHAKGSARRLFLLTYGVGTIVTIFLSNDATAVVLTPAVAAAVHTAKAEQPLPYLLICAFIANAASFVLPISNPANLVIYGSHMPPLLHWLPAYALPSVRVDRGDLFGAALDPARRARPTDRKDVPVPILVRRRQDRRVGIAATAIVLLAASAFDIQLGLPTADRGRRRRRLIVLIRERKGPWLIVKDISWGVLPLVAGLFVLVEALDKTGLIGMITTLLHQRGTSAPQAGPPGAPALSSPSSAI